MHKNATEHLGYVIRSTAWGWLAVVGSARGVCGVVGPRSSRRPIMRELNRRWPQAGVAEASGRGNAQSVDRRGLHSAARQLADYLAGRRRAFAVRLDLSGLTAFQRRVLRACRRIGYGRTDTYAELARRVGRPRAARAVGQVMAANPVPLLVPCHRVVRSDGGLGGFSAPGGMSLKQRLLRLERRRSSTGDAP